jgi:NADPH-dependent F420 reductase
MSNQRIAIIGGTGDQGKGLGIRWARTGAEIVIGSRDAVRAETAAQEMRNLLGDSVSIQGASNADAAANAPIVVLTVPFAAQITTLKEIRERLSPGSLLIDVTVPIESAVGGKPTRTLGVWAGSAAEQCAELAPAGVQTISAFHNVGAAALQELSADVDCDIIVCGDDKSAREKARPLVEAIPGCRYIDGGPLQNSRIVESMTALIIGFNIRYKAHCGIRITGI